MSRRGNVVFEKNTPKFLQAYYNKENDAVVAQNEKLSLKEEREDRDDELPSVSNQEEFAFEIKNDLVNGLQGKSFAKPETVTQEENNNELQPETVVPKEEQEESVNVAAEQRFSETVVVGLRKVARRVEDETADLVEAETGKHVFRKANKRQINEQEGNKEEKKVKTNKKSLLSFDVDE